MSDTPTFDPVPLLAEELDLPAASVAAVVKLLADGNTVPFIARYRKEATGSLDEVQIRTIEERRAYLLELEERRQAILASVAEQGKLSPELEAKIRACTSKSVLEDLYLPYKPKRRTRATIARDKGLEPLALRIAAQPGDGAPRAEAEAFVSVDKEVGDVDAALAGARDIVAEMVAENADVRAFVRETFGAEGVLVSVSARDGSPPSKFEQYYDFREPVKAIPSHRFLAIRRGERENALRAHIEVDGERIVARLQAMMGVASASPFSGQLQDAIADSYKRLIAPSVENDVRVDLKMRADREAVEVFADNLRNLLLAAPLGGRAVIGIDPGLRTGCKCAAVDATGKFLGHTTFYLTRGEKGLMAARGELKGFLRKFPPAAVAVGNGTGGRDAEAFVRKLLADENIADLFVVQVNEAGASVYSASELARDEFPHLDLTIRGAISIARRLQDPLAELVKIEPKAIGVGQYQHDVHQPLLVRKLGEVIESCVNHVGVELNTASAPLLSYVAGVGDSLAKKIIAHREENGAFWSRQQLLEVGGLGPRTFQQAAGFLRIHNGVQPLDSSAVHPERYPLVERMAADLGVEVGQLIGNAELAGKIDISRYVSDEVGEPTLRDIVEELRKPGRDPRDEFEPPRFREDVNTLDDLQQGMVLEGVVTNVTAFGAFVDIGVHQDGLVHISQLADKFVKDPAEVVKVGDKLKVRVLEVDVGRKRISLSARSESASEAKPAAARQTRGPGKGRGKAAQASANASANGGDGRGRGKGQRGGKGRGPRSGKPADAPPQAQSQAEKKQFKRFSNNPFAKLADIKIK